MAFGLGNDKVDSDPNFLNFSSLDAAEMTCMASQTNLNVKIQSKRIRIRATHQGNLEFSGNQEAQASPICKCKWFEDWFLAPLTLTCEREPCLNLQRSNRQDLKTLAVFVLFSSRKLLFEGLPIRKLNLMATLKKLTAQLIQVLHEATFRLFLRRQKSPKSCAVRAESKCCLAEK